MSQPDYEPFNLIEVMFWDDEVDDFYRDYCLEHDGPSELQMVKDLAYESANEFPEPQPVVIISGHVFNPATGEPEPDEAC